MNNNDSNKSNNDLENIELNKMFCLTYNFDILKYIITNLIKGQQNSNYKLLELKLEKTYNDKRMDELECNLIDLKLLGEISEKDKDKLIEKKNQIKSKDYQNKIDKYTKEKDFCLKLIKNSNKEKSLINGFINDKNYKFEEDTEEEVKTSEKNVKKKELDEFNQKIENKIEQINSNIKEKIGKVDEKLKSYEKMFNLFDTNLKISEEKINNKFKTEIPKIFENIYSSRIISVESSIENLEKKLQEDLKNSEEKIHKKEDEKLNDLQKEIQNKFQEINKKYKEMLKDNMKINEKIDNCTPLEEHKKFLVDIEKRISKDKTDLNNEITKIKKIIEKIKIDFDEMVNDNTDHNNLITLSKKVESLSTIVFNFREFQVEYQQDKKKIAQIEPTKLVYLDAFHEFKDSINIILENYKKNFSDIKYVLEDLKSASYNGKASLKDLKKLEDTIKDKIFELKEKIKENYADKNYIIKNNKYLQIQIKQQFEEYKKNEQNSSWILAKKPIGLLCASCEAYLGEMKEKENDRKYIPWNKYPTKESKDKIYRVGSGFSKLLQKIGSEKKIRKNKSSFRKKKDNSNEEISLRQIINKNLQRNNQNNISFDNEENKTNVRDIPKLPLDNIVKNKTATNFMNVEETMNKSELRNTYNNLFKSNTNSNIIKNKAIHSSIVSPKTDRDEIIVVPTSLNKYRELSSKDEEISGPKIIKVYKKSNLEKSS